MENDQGAEADQDDVVTLRHNGRLIHLVGVVAHSRVSAERVRKVIATHQPDTLCLGLCAEHNLLERSFWSTLSPLQMLKSGHVLFWLDALAWQAVRAKLTNASALAAQLPFLAAFDAAKSSEVVFIDRHPQVTFTRVWHNAPLFHRTALIASMWPRLFAKDTPVEADTIETLKATIARKETATEVPVTHPKAVHRVVLENADYQRQMLKKTQGDVIAVVSKWLVQPIATSFNDDIDVAQLTAAPTIGKSWAALRWLIAGLGWWLLWNNGAVGLGNRFACWFAAIGIASTLFSILSRGHGVTIVTGAVVAPVAALLPVWRPGVVVGSIEARVRRPTAADGLAIYRDGLTNSELRANPIVRPLLLSFMVDAGVLVSAVVTLTWLAI